MKKGLFNCIIIILLWGCLPPEREIVSIVRIENNTGFYLDSLWLGVHSFKGLADSEFTNYVEVIDGDIGIAALIFIVEEAKPTDADDIIGLEKLKNKKYTLQLYAKAAAPNGYIPFCDRLIVDD